MVLYLFIFGGGECYWKNDHENYLVLASSRRETQARRKDFVKVTVKFIRRGTVWRKERETFPVPHAGNGSKDSKWWPPTPSFILESWRKYTWSKIMGLGG
jgi:hypothetical protein